MDKCMGKKKERVEMKTDKIRENVREQKEAKTKASKKIKTDKKSVAKSP